jgi:hypothetical protein
MSVYLLNPNKYGIGWLGLDINAALNAALNVLHR